MPLRSWDLRWEMNAISFLFQTSLICGINLLQGVCEE